MYLVVEWPSAPTQEDSGSAGVANVLSTISGTPGREQSSLPNAQYRKDNQRRFATVSPKTHGIWSNAALISRRCICEKRAPTPIFLRVIANKLKGPAINGGKRNKVIPSLVEDGKEACCLTRRSQHCSSTALKSANLEATTLSSVDS